MDEKGFWHPDNFWEAIQLIEKKLKDPEFIARAERVRAELGDHKFPASEPDSQDEEKPGPDKP